MKLTQDKARALLAVIEHTRTSCSDENVCNGHGSTSYGGYRCSRCLLLDFINYDIGPDIDVNAEVTFSITDRGAMKKRLDALNAEAESLRKQLEQAT